MPLAWKYPSVGGKEVAKTEFTSGFDDFQNKVVLEGYFFQAAVINVAPLNTKPTAVSL